MDNTYSLIEDLKKNLDSEDTIINLKEKYKDIKNDKELMDKIKQYNIYHDDNLREELISNDKIKDVKHLEAILNYMILEINNKLKTISKKDGCM